VKAFIPEDFWYILLSLNREINGEVKKVDFTWRRGHLFEADVVAEIFEDILENSRARVTKVTQKNTKKWYVILLFFFNRASHRNQETATTDDRRASKGGIEAA
jgi:DNA topoisomerase IA